jgi:single-strand DNA-binding protein
MYHTIILIGNLGREPEARFTPTGQPVTTLSVATNRKYRDVTGKSVMETTWFWVTVWGKHAEACRNNLHTGNKVLVEGRFNPDPQTGGPRIWQMDERMHAQYEVTANVVRFLSGRDEVIERTESRNDEEDEKPIIKLDDIPF